MKLTLAQREVLEKLAVDPHGALYRRFTNCWTTISTPLQKPIGLLSAPTWWAPWSTVRALERRGLLLPHRASALPVAGIRGRVYVLSRTGRAVLAEHSENSPGPSES